MVVLVLALLLALAMLVAVVVAPLLADARGRKPPRLATRAGEKQYCDEGGVGGGVCGGIRVVTWFFISKIINKLCLPITTPLPVCSVIQPSGVKTCLLNVCNAVVS